MTAIDSLGSFTITPRDNAVEDKIIIWNLPSGPLYFAGLTDNFNSKWVLKSHDAHWLPPQEIEKAMALLVLYEGINKLDLSTEFALT